MNKNTISLFIVFSVLFLALFSCSFLNKEFQLFPACSAFPRSVNISAPHTFTTINNSNGNIKWQNIGAGVNMCFTKEDSLGNIFVGFSGMGVQLDWGSNWVKNLYKNSLYKSNVATLFSLEGPNHKYYFNHEIDTKVLADKIIILCSLLQNKDAQIIIVAHSSGIFVAHYFFQQLFDKGYDKSNVLKDRIHFFSLDGALGKNQGIRLTDVSAQNIKMIYGVYASDSLTATNSARYKDIIDLCVYFKEKAKIVIVDGSNSGCTPKAIWCYHQVLINSKPHNPNGIDLYNDYINIDSVHSVTTSYLNSIQTKKLVFAP